MTVTRELEFSVAVLAGGSSRRMGRDKALIEIDGDAMVLRVVDEARRAGAREVLVVGRPPGAWPGVVSVPDRYPGEGPLGGVITALGLISTQILVLMPCDLLSPSSSAVREVVAELDGRESGDPADAVVPLVGDRLQYVQTAMRVSLAAQLEERFAAGERSIRGGLHGAAVVEAVFEDSTWFADADEPGDLPIASRDDDFGISG